jgi:hypothetical protein
MTTDLMNVPLSRRYQLAMRDLRRARVCVRNNVYKCCRGCVNEDDFPTWKKSYKQPLIWSFGGQGNAVTIYGDSAYYRDSHHGECRATKNYLMHDNITPKVWETVKAIYNKYGIVVDWDGSPYSAITLDYKKSTSAAWRAKYAHDITEWQDAELQEV